MKIDKLHVGNFKGKNRAYEFGAINVVVGDNWSGKTTVLNAIRVGLLGHDPKLGARNSDTFKLASGAKMGVELDFGGKLKLQRVWTESRGSIRFETKSDIEKFSVPPVLLDVREYFSMSGPKRREYVMGMIAGKVDDAAIEAKIKAIPVDGDATKQREVNEILEEFEYWCGDRDEHKTPVSEWIGDLLAIANQNRISERTAKIKEMTAILTQIADARAAAPVAKPADQTADLKGFRAERDELQTKLGQAREAVRRYDQSERARLELAAIDPTKIEGKIATLTLELKKLEKAKPSPTEQSLAPKIKLLISKKAICEADMRAANGKKAELEKAIEKALGSKCCPTCGSENDFAEYRSAYIKKLTGEIEALKAEGSTLLRRGVEIATELEEATEKEKKIEASDKARSKWESDVTNVKADITVEKSKLESYQYRKSLIAEVMLPSPMPDAFEVAILAQDQAIAAAEDMQSRREELLKREAAETMAEAGRKELEAQVAVAREWVKILTELQTKLIDGAFLKFVENVRKFTDGLLGFTLEYRDGEIGYIRDGTWVGHDTFSGSEQALVYAGLGVALAQASDVKVVMIDEVLLTGDNKKKIAKRMYELVVDGIIDQFIACDVSAKDWGKNVKAIEA